MSTHALVRYGLQLCGPCLLPMLCDERKPEWEFGALLAYALAGLHGLEYLLASLIFKMQEVLIAQNSEM